MKMRRKTKNKKTKTKINSTLFSDSLIKGEGKYDCN
jgi:hypothetical protein